jgi:hypothetical protein
VSDGGFHINQRISFLDFGFQQAALSAVTLNRWPWLVIHSKTMSLIIQELIVAAPTIFGFLNYFLRMSNMGMLNHAITVTWDKQIKLVSDLSASR